MRMKMSVLNSCLVRRGTVIVNTVRFHSQITGSLTGVELRIGKQAHEMFTIARIDMISLQMQGNVTERIWIAVNIQRLHVTSSALITMYLLSEEMREI